MINVETNAKESHKDLTLIKKCCQIKMNDYFNISTVCSIFPCFPLISPDKLLYMPYPCEANEKLYFEFNLKERIAIVLIISHPLWVLSKIGLQALVWD